MTTTTEEQKTSPLRPPGLTLSESILQLASRVPGQLALRLLFPSTPPVDFSYGSLVADARRMAGLLEDCGVKPGQVVVLVLPHGPALIRSFLGALLFGAVPSIFAPPSAKFAPEAYRSTLLRLLEACDTRFVLTTREWGQQWQHERITTLNPEQAQENPADYPFEPQRPEALALLQHSSGTTGLKKGVALSHCSVLNQVRAASQALLLTESDTIVSWLPLYHDMGFMACFVMPLVTGVPVVMMSPFDWVAQPALLLKAIHTHRGTLCWQPNFAYSLLAARVRPEESRGLDLSSMRAFINCAEPVSARSHRQFLARFSENGVTDAMLHTSYAMAENTFAVTQSDLHDGPRVEDVDAELLAREGRAEPARPGGGPTRTMVASGRLVKNTELRILDAQGSALPERRVGEIVIRSDCMLSEYFRRPDATAEALRDGWYLTGDLGYLADGQLVVVGRKKDMLIVAGKNIYPQDVEEIVSAVPGVYPGRVVAFGVPNEALGTEDLVVLAETLDDDPSRQLAIRLGVAKAVRAELECVAREVVLLPHRWLLKSSSGKISRTKNKERYLQEDFFSRLPSASPSTLTEGEPTR